MALALATKAASFAGGIARAFRAGYDSATRFGYDAVEDKGRRKPPVPLTRSEDRELTPTGRRTLVSSARDLQRNFSIAAWAIRKHLDYVSSFTFHPRTGDDALDAELAGLMAWWSRPINCDAAGRHSLPRLVRLFEACRTVDGDVFANQLVDGRLQAIEGDRVRNPLSGLPTTVNPQDLIHGVLVDDFLRARAFAVCDRLKQSNEVIFRAMLSAAFTLQLGYFTRFDQVRGIAPMASAINTFRDIYENFDYALAKAKVSQLFAMVVTRDNSEGLGATVATEAEGAETGGPRYKPDFNRGPVMLDLDPGDDAKVIESDTPSSEFQAFTQEMVGVALKSLDIPVCFYDEGRANFSSGRQGWILYEQSAQAKRADLREFLNRITAWRVGMWIVSGDLVLPKGKRISDLKWEWVHAGIPWIDPLKEVTADAAAINSGLNSRTRILKEAGLDFTTIVDELAAEKAYAKTKGIEFPDTPISVVVQPDPPEQQGNGKH